MLTRCLALTLGLATTACGSSSSSPPDASTAAVACEQVGVALCHQFYACYTASERDGFQLPATEAECVTMDNANCGESKPGYCKGAAQTSAANATACAADLSGMTCTQFKGTPPAGDVCKTQLCAP